MVADIFPGMKVVILGQDGSELTTVLPLDEFMSAGESEPAAPVISGEVSDLG